MSQFEFPAFRWDHPETSQQASLQIAPAVETLRAKVLDCIRDHNGCTDQEVQTYLQMPGNTQRPRRQELVRGGFVKDSGDRRRTVKGRAAIVWVAT